MKYHVGQTVEREYNNSPLPAVLQYQIGTLIPINEGGQTVAMGEVTETGPDKYKLQIINTYGHRRGPSEIK